VKNHVGIIIPFTGTAGELCATHVIRGILFGMHGIDAVPINVFSYSKKVKVPEGIKHVLMVRNVDVNKFDPGSSVPVYLPDYLDKSIDESSSECEYWRNCLVNWIGPFKDLKEDKKFERMLKKVSAKRKANATHLRP